VRAAAVAVRDCRLATAAECWCRRRGMTEVVAVVACCSPCTVYRRRCEYTTTAAAAAAATDQSLRPPTVAGGRTPVPNAAQYTRRRWLCGAVVARIGIYTTITIITINNVSAHHGTTYNM